MKIEFNNIGAEKIINKIAEFEINSNLTLRIAEEKEKVSIKLRNGKFTELGRIFKFDNIQDVTQIVLDGVIYENLKYLQHELYIHGVKDEEVELGIAEDFNITFSKIENEVSNDEVSNDNVSDNKTEEVENN